MEIRELDKQSIRKKMIKQRQDLSLVEYQDKSCSIIESLMNHPYYKEATTIGIYISFRQEVDTASYLEKIALEKQVCVPVIQDKEMCFVEYKKENLEKSKFGILEPVDGRTFLKDEIDLLVIPVVAFHKNGYRVGYGGGYYDRYLKEYQGHSIALAFSFQEIEELDFEEFDERVEAVLCEIS